jgi:hypothetical protein
MSLTVADMSQLEAMLATSDGGAQLAHEFRARFPGRSLTRCDESDMGGEEPFRRFDTVDLYLVDGRDHCWHITRDPALATGVVLAQRKRRS